MAPSTAVQAVRAGRIISEREGCGSLYTCAVRGRCGGAAGSKFTKFTPSRTFSVLPDAGNKGRISEEVHGLSDAFPPDTDPVDRLVRHGTYGDYWRICQDKEKGYVAHGTVISLLKITASLSAATNYPVILTTSIFDRSATIKRQ
jgi:hypothetical protein